MSIYVLTYMCDQKPTRPHIHIYRPLQRHQVKANKLTFTSSDQTCNKLPINRTLDIHLPLRRKKDMSFLVYYLILHLCVSMHACTSRPLGVFHTEHGKGLTRLTKTSEIMPEIKGENVKENIIERNESKVEFHSDEPNTLIGSDIKVEVSREETKIEGWKDHARSTMESRQQDSKEAINNFKKNIVMEDVVVMDYAQPHRKPPIHNLTP